MKRRYLILTMVLIIFSISISGCSLKSEEAIAGEAFRVNLEKPKPRTNQLALKLPNGEICYSNSDCNSNFCDIIPDSHTMTNPNYGYCTGTKRNGEACNVNDDCGQENSNCVGGFCSGQLNVERCIRDTDCSSRNCVGNVCGDYLRKNPGESCEFDQECKSPGNCVRGMCVLDRTGPNEICLHDFHCLSGYCNQETNVCELIRE